MSHADGGYGTPNVCHCVVYGEACSLLRNHSRVDDRRVATYQL
jgi:hypothetical protein